MILSDFDLMSVINGKRLVITPFDQELVRENGIDLRLDNEVGRHPKHGDDFVMDPTVEEHRAKSYEVFKNQDEIIIHPHEQILLSTNEEISVPNDLMGFVELRSTWARHGLSMPPTIIDAGFSGNVTLEVINHSPYKIKLKPMQRFAHIIFAKTSSQVANAYSGQYKGQRGVRIPKLLK